MHKKHLATHQRATRLGRAPVPHIRPASIVSDSRAYRNMKYTYRTRDGVIAIIPQGSAFHVVFCGEDLGEFGTAQLAADDVSAGHVDLRPRGVDLAALGIPCNISEWMQS